VLNRFRLLRTNPPHNSDNHIKENEVKNEGNTSLQECPPVPSMNPEITVKKVISRARKPDLNAFLSRPFLVQNISWTATATAGTRLATITLPDALFPIQAFLDKIKKFAFWSPSFEVTFRVNGTGFHYGRVVCWWQPQAKSLPLSYTSAKRAFTSPNWIQLDACSSVDNTFFIPYTYYTDMVTVGALTDDIATIYVDVSCPLRVPAGTASPIDIAVFVRCITPNQQGFTDINDFTTQMFSVVRSGVISSTVRGLGNAVSDLIEYVDWSGVSNGIQRYTGLVADVLHFFGFSNPPNLTTTSLMQIRQPNMFKVSDTINTVSLAMSNDRQCVHAAGRIGMDLNELDITDILQKPFLVSTVTVSSLTAPGSILYGKTLTTGWISNPNEGGEVVSPITYFASMFRHWRGSLKFTISAVCSTFHNARFRIVYIPVYPPATANPDLLTASNYENIIFDLSTSHDCTFVIPFMQTRNWCVTDGADRINGNNGILMVQQMNTLTSSVSPVSDMSLQIFVSACSDFQFGTPVNEGVTKSDWFVQMDCSRVTLTHTTVACSSTCLREADAINIGAGRPFITGFDDVINIIPSVLSLTKLPTIYKWTDTKHSMFIFPFTSWQVRAGGVEGTSYLAKMEALFRYKKGGYRVTVISDQNNYDQGIDVGFIPWNTAITTVYTPIDTVKAETALGNGAFQSRIANSNPVDIIIPYNSIYNKIPTSLKSELTLANKSACGALLTKIGETAVPRKVFLSSADDYRLIHYIGIPIIAAKPTTFLSSDEFSWSDIVDPDGKIRPMSPIPEAKLDADSISA